MRNLRSWAAIVGLLSAFALGSSAHASTTLVDQMSHQAVTGSDSTHYRTAMIANVAADDFVVPSGRKWQIQRVDLAGRFVGSPASYGAVTVIINRNDRGLPGRDVASTTVHDNRVKQGSFSVPVSLPALAPGRYWLLVYVRMYTPVADPEGATWQWTNRTVRSGYPAAYRMASPQDYTGYYWLDLVGVSPPCEAWVTRSNVCGGNASSPDQAFRLVGISSAM